MAQRGQQIVRPNGGMNLDLAKELIPENQATFLKNVIQDYNSGTAAQNGKANNIGVLTPALSNVANASFHDNLPSGINICIGAKYDRKLNQLFYFVWNNTFQHTIWIYDANTNISEIVVYSSLLNFQPNYPITHIDVVIVDQNIVEAGLDIGQTDRLLYWTDGFNPPRKINVDTALNGGYGALTFLRTPDEYIQAVKYPPLDITIESTLANPDPTFPLNYILNKQFQFRAKYYYEDGEHTTTGAISTLAYTTNRDYNFFELHLTAGSSLVDYVELFFRLGNTGDWKSCDVIERDLIILNTVYPYNAGTNVFIYKFFNNQQYNIVDQADVNRPFDWMPQKAYTQEFIEQNVMLYGNILEGYANMEVPQPQVEITYDDFEPLTLTLDVSLAWTLLVGTITIEVHKIDFETGIDTVEDTETITGISADPFVFQTVLTNIGFGDQVYLDWTGAGSIDNSSFMTGTYSNIKDDLACSVAPYFGGFSVAKNDGNQAGNGTITFTTENADPCSTWSIVTSRHTVPHTSDGWAQLKQGGKYQFGYIAYDAALRSSFVQTNNNMILDIEPIQESPGFQTHTITISWGGFPNFPEWVKYVKICRTKNLNIDRSLGKGYIQCSIGAVAFLKYDGTAGTPGTDEIKKIQFNLFFLIDFNTKYYQNTTTDYTWSEGDRIQFIRNGEGTYYDIATNGLLDFVLSTDPSAPNVNFLCDYAPELATLESGAWVEIYTPNKESKNNIFYEIGDFIPTTGIAGINFLSEDITTLTTFDTFPAFWFEPFVDDDVNDSGATPFEHHSIYLEGTVPSHGEDIGRINVVNVDARQLWYPARVRYSYAYLPNTFHNGLSSFAEQNKKDFFRQYGGITVLFSDQSRLLLIQEDNHFRSMLGKLLMSLADGSVAIVASDQFISDPIEINGDYGCQNPESFQEWNGRMFWVDAKRGCILECNWQDTRSISQLTMIESYAETKLKSIHNYNYNPNTYVTCCWDLSGLNRSTLEGGIDALTWEVDGAWVYVSIDDSNPTMEQIAGYMNGAGYDTYYVDGDSICVTDYQFVPGRFKIFDAIEGDLIFEVSVACQINKFIVPSGYDPEHKLYLNTFFNLNTQPKYYWVLQDFQTGENIQIFLEIDEVDTSVGVFDIETTEDILAAMQLLGGDNVFELIVNNGVLKVVSIDNKEYGTLTIGNTSFAVRLNGDQYTYNNNSYNVAIAENETIAYNILGELCNGFYGFTPEYYCYIDAHLDGVAMVTFKEGVPYFHNLNTVETFNIFYGTQTSQVVRVVCNASPQTEKRFQTIGYDSKNKTSVISGIRYGGNDVATSDHQESEIPIDAFNFRENFYYGTFFRDTQLGTTIQNGQNLRGTWCEIGLLRDTDADTEPLYNELSKIIFNFITSEKSVK